MRAQGLGGGGGGGGGTGLGFRRLRFEAALNPKP